MRINLSPDKWNQCRKIKKKNGENTVYENHFKCPINFVKLRVDSNFDNNLCKTNVLRISTKKIESKKNRNGYTSDWIGLNRTEFIWLLESIFNQTKWRNKCVSQKESEKKIKSNIFRGTLDNHSQSSALEPPFLIPKLPQCVPIEFHFSFSQIYERIKKYFRTSKTTKLTTTVAITRIYNLLFSVRFELFLKIDKLKKKNQ